MGHSLKRLVISLFTDGSVFHIWVQVCVEAGMIALRHEQTEIKHEDFMEGITQVQAKKKASLEYYA